MIDEAKLRAAIEAVNAALREEEEETVEFLAVTQHTRLRADGPALAIRITSHRYVRS